MAAPQQTVATKPHKNVVSCFLTRGDSKLSLTAADIVLESSNGTSYLIPSYTLRTTSGFFRTMLSLPQPPGERTGTIKVHQPDDTVEPLLHLMCGLDVRPWRSFEDLAAVLALAENWDTPGPISSLRAALSSRKWLKVAPLRIYALAVHFGWRAEAELASTETLDLDLSHPSYAETLLSLPGPALISLLRLQRARRDALRALLDSPTRFLAGNGNPYHCGTCSVTPLDNTTWRALKHRIFREMERRSLGDMLGVPVGGMCEWVETQACWEARCQKPGCGATNYDRVATLKQIRACVDGLPRVIEWNWD